MLWIDEFFTRNGVIIIAVAGGAVPVLHVWLENGVVKTGYSGHANGSVVVDDVAEVYRRIVAGEKIFMHRYGNNYVTLLEMVRGEKYPQEVVK